ncbi:tape measure protein [Falsochrobactrum ovis]|uniref:Tape measure domain-containing protein n=1 Tax=Falsochrobactrum ovis TaxID=1293442 RepID=A0A364JSS6_9HYPH|nr:tape measure protein [Falsochrobactrum ovis]RAK26382.1 tape measure domain-containing protein [Falsochrobactrum ovis]
MAVTVEELRATLRMEMKPFMRDLQQMNGVSAKAARQVEGTWRAANKRLDSIGKNMARSLVAPMAGIGAVLGTREIAKFADEWTVAGNKIAAASVVAGRQARTLSELNEIARATRSGLSETADLYAKLLRSTADVAKSELEVAKATEIVNKAFKAGGAAASEQAAGILQLAQGLGSGMLQGDELRSVRENAPLLAQAIADYFGTTIAGLKELGSEGQLTSDKIFQAILAAQGRVEGAFKATNSTIAEGFTMVNNAMIEYVGTADAGYGVTKQLVGGLTILADNFDKTADVVLQLAGVIAGALIGRSLLKMISTLGLAGSALKRFMSALAAARTMAGLATSFTGLSAAAGPVGLLIGGAVAGSLALYSSNAAAASTQSQKFEKELISLGLLAPKTAKGIDDAANAIENLGKANTAQKIRSIADELRRLQTGDSFGGAGDELSSIASSARSGGLKRLFDDDADRKARASIIEMINELQSMQIATDEVRRRLDLIRTTPISDAVKEMADTLDYTTRKIEALQTQSYQLGVMPGMQQAQDDINAVINDLDRLEKREIITSEQRKNLESALVKLRDTGEGADEARKALASIDGISFSTTLVGLDSLIGRVSTLFTQADLAAKALGQTSRLGSSSFSRGGSTVARQERLERQRKDAEYVANAKQRAALSKAQYDLENKIAQVRSRSEKDGRKLTDAQIKEIAQAELAGDAARSAEGRAPAKPKRERVDEYERLTRSIADRTAAMIAETEAQRQLNPLIEDYDYAIEKARATQELLNAAEKAGIEINPALRAEVARTAEQWALATMEANQLAEAHDELRQKAEEWRDTEQGAFKGLVSDLAAGKSAVEALTDAVQKLIDKLLDMALTDLFDGAFGKSGSLFGGILGLRDGGVVKAASGGYIRGPGGPRTDSIPAMLSNGEYVVNAAATKQFKPLLDRINSGGMALAGGGMAALRAPTMPVLSGIQRQTTVESAPQININIASASGDDYIRAVVSDGVNQGLRQYDKSGAMRFARDSKQAARRGLVR